MNLEKRGENYIVDATPVQGAESTVEAAEGLDFHAPTSVNPEDLTEGGPLMSTLDSHISAFASAPPLLHPTITKTDEDTLTDVMNSDLLAGVTAPEGTRAVVYLRVSSKGQVNTDYDPEGISIPAQRTACTRKAEQLGLTIIAEYVEPGRSATEMTKRVAFQQMLERIRRERDVDYVIVYKLSRFARNRIDDAVVMADLQKRGVTLISATEQIDSTPVGQLMHGILAAFNQYRSEEDGADIAYKMGQKVKNGGTIGRAPIGYLNTIDRVDGREIRSVRIDELRAPFVKLAFQMYASGEYTMEDIVDELSERGLTTRATAHRPAGSVSTSKMSRLLRDRYYIGELVYKGEIYSGRHKPIVDRDLFVKVQDMLISTGRAGERKRIHPHYLKGSLWCGECYAERGIPDSRMIIQRALGRNGQDYFYFFCRARQEGRCDSRHLAFEMVEDAVLEHYCTVQLQPAFIDAVEQAIDAALDDQAGAQRLLRNQLKNQLNRLSVQADNLVELVANGGLASTKARERIRTIEHERGELEAKLSHISDDLSAGAEYIRGWLKLLSDPRELYLKASDEMRRQLNQAIFKRIWITDADRAKSELSEPARLLIDAQRHWAQMITSEQSKSQDSRPGTPAQTLEDSLEPMDFALVSSKPYMVPLEGLEPPTLSLGRTRSSIELQRLTTTSLPGGCRRRGTTHPQIHRTVLGQSRASQRIVARNDSCDGAADRPAGRDPTRRPQRTPIREQSRRTHDRRERGAPGCLASPGCHSPRRGRAPRSSSTS